jgi:hypothetical protein
MGSRQYKVVVYQVRGWFSIYHHFSKVFISIFSRNFEIGNFSKRKVTCEFEIRISEVFLLNVIPDFCKYLNHVT